FFLISCKTEGKKTESGVTYTMYYFHPTTRCESCINIENFTKELIENKYTKNPEIKFIALNIEDSQNEHFRKDYDLKFSSVVISKLKDDKEEKYKNLDSIWTYSSDKDGFFKYMDSEIKEFIK
ncbi:MAG: nitrophenyl compound nitroreductase subunit ArsF family protein, partial [Ignavibacteriae bacterium]|nr:nitrophenyl compound nitroreductase subunit ArsF family protein [Ignavibacteriota bacterium]